MVGSVAFDVGRYRKCESTHVVAVCQGRTTGAGALK
jgi:hypothetical protein